MKVPRLSQIGKRRVKKFLVYSVIAILFLAMWSCASESPDEIASRERTEYLWQEFGKFCWDEYNAQREMCVYNAYLQFLQEFYPDDYQKWVERRQEVEQ